MSGFVGRKDQLAYLKKTLSQIGSDAGDKPGRALLMRGRRRVGKSRLVEEFLDVSGAPGVFFAASKQTQEDELRFFSEAVLESNLPGKDAFNGVNFTNWPAALRMLVSILPENGPSVVVIDELPYLIQTDEAFEGTLQKIFDREMSRKRVLFIGIGSDLGMMEALNEYGRPFHQRATEVVIPPLSPAEVADMLQLNSMDALDAYLVTGGLPLICRQWQPGATLVDFLSESLATSTSALVVSGERSLAAEFPPDAQPRDVLSAIGSGERTFTKIGLAAGGIQQKSLQRGLETLVAKRILAVDLPLSTKTSGESRYYITDPYLRFWLSFIGPHLPEIERGRGDRVLQRVQISWTSWRGKAVEPIIRESIERIPNPTVGGATPVVGGYWTRSNNPEIDLVVADRAPVARTIFEVGSIKWRDSAVFSASDLAELETHRRQLPGATLTTPLLMVSRSGFGLVATRDQRLLGPDDLVNAWR